MYTRLWGVDVHIYGQGSGFFPHPSPIWTSSVATHLNLRRHLLAIRISSKIKCLIRYDFRMRFRVFRSQKMKCLSKPSRGKNRCVFFPLFSNLQSAVFSFLREREKMKYQASFSPSLQTKGEEGPPDRRLTIFTILNNHHIPYKTYIESYNRDILFFLKQVRWYDNHATANKGAVGFCHVYFLRNHCRRQYYCRYSKI